MATETVANAITAAIDPVVVSITTGAITNARLETRSWYAITNKEDGSAEIKIYEDIGIYGVSAKRFTDDLERIGAEQIHVRLNTYGGEVFDGIAIYSALRAHPADIIVHVDGIAASAGSIIAMSGDEIRISDNAFLMIHEARGGVFGEAEDMRKYGEILDKLNDSIAATYQQRAGKGRKYWRDKMAEETWFTAAEAKAEGLVDRIDDHESTAENRFDFKAYNQIRHLPEAVLKTWGKPERTVALENGKTLLASPDGTITHSPNQQSPETSPSGGPPPAVSRKETEMSTETQAAAVQTPAPAATPQQGVNTTQQEVMRLNDASISTYIEKGKVVGRAEGRQQLMEEIRSVITAAANRPMIAINAILAGQNAATVQLLVLAETNAEIAANKRAEQQEVEIARLRAEQARLMELNSTGGHPGVAVSVFAPAAGGQRESQPSGLEPESQAKLEWDSDPMLRARNNNNEKAWMLYRVNQLKGNVRILKTA